MVPCPDGAPNDFAARIAKVSAAWAAFLETVDVQTPGIATSFTINEVREKPHKLVAPLSRGRGRPPGTTVVRGRRRASTDGDAGSFATDPLNGYFPDDPHTNQPPALPKAVGDAA